MPTFCRHNRFLANCPICSGDQVEVVSNRRTSPAKPARSTPPRPRSGSSATRGGRAGGLRVRQIAREQEDGFRSTLIPGVKASAAAERLADELAFAVARLELLAAAPPGLYADVAAAPAAASATGQPAAAAAGSAAFASQPAGAVAQPPAAPAQPAAREEALWLAFLIAYLGPLDGEDPFAGVRAAHTSWASGALSALDDVPLGPRTAHDPARGTDTLVAYRAWAERAGSQDAAFAGEASWAPERRFARAYERLALPGLHRDARFDLLVAIGQLGLHELCADALQLGGADETTIAAKRVFGIADTLLLERRAHELAEAAELPLAALDLALWNWNRPPRPGGERDRATLGTPDVEPDADAYARVAAALGL
ncbi:MAG TPA: hypothetical protein VF250_11035 [Conexibacter sp.]